MEQIVYTSDAAATWHSDELLGLLMRAAAANEGRDVTGLLLFEYGVFAQCIEGPCEEVDALWRKVQKDQRHENVLLLKREALTSRWFPDWRMGLASDLAETLQIEGWCPPVRGKLVDARSDPSAVVALFETLSREYAKPADQ
jgi:Sensors of blue-light using FAD